MFIAVCSLKSSPGATTLALALAAHATVPARRLLVECDPAGGDLAMRAGLPPSPGLVSLAAAARRTREATTVWDHAHTLPSGVCVVPAPPEATRARHAVHTLATAPDGPLLDTAATAHGVLVLADCGRMDPGSPAEAIARRAGALLVVTGTGGDDLGHLAARHHELATWTPRTGLVLTGAGYPTAEIEAELGLSALGRLPHDPLTAAALAGQRPRPRRLGGLARCAAQLAHTLTIGPAPPPPAAEEPNCPHRTTNVQSCITTPHAAQPSTARRERNPR